MSTNKDNIIPSNLESGQPNDGSTAMGSRAAQPNQKDPHLQQEPTGPIASDSLAAESLESGGAFARNDHATAMGVKGASSTLANDDTSGARRLAPAADAEDREAGDLAQNDSSVMGNSGLKYPEGAGHAEFSGNHNLEGYTGGPSSARGATAKGEYSTGLGSTKGGTGGAGHTSGETHRSQAAGAGTTAPTYAARTAGTLRSEGELKPRGSNLHEGLEGKEIRGTHTGDVGGPHDPGREAEGRFEKMNANVAAGGGGGGGPRQDHLDSENPYAALNSERAGDQSSHME